MNETMSLLLATAILAAGGIGLFMFRSDDESKFDNDKYDDNLEDYDEDIIFDDFENDYIEEPDYKPRSKSANKTKRNKKSGGSKRRY